MALSLNFVRTVWVSYSGQDSLLVNALARLVEERGRDESTPFRMLTYLRDAQDNPAQELDNKSNTTELLQQTNQPFITFLKAGERIEDLVQTIASNLRRVFFFSESYLDSRYCMREFVYSLVREPLNPMCIFLIGFDGDFGKFRAERNFAFMPQQEGCLLEDALTWVYLNERKNQSPEFSIVQNDGKSIEPEVFFKNKLDDLQGRLYTGVAEPTSQQLQVLFDVITRYVKSVTPEQLIATHQRLRLRKIEDWVGMTTIGNNCKRNGITAETIEHALSMNPPAADVVQNLCQSIQRLPLNELQLICQKRPEDIEQIASIIMTAAINPLWAAEVDQNCIRNNPVRLSSNYDDPMANNSLNNLYLYTGLAAAKGHWLKMKTRKDELTPEVRNVIHFAPDALEEDMTKQHDPMLELLALVMSKDVSQVKVIEKTLEPFKKRVHINRFLKSQGNSAITFCAESGSFAGKEENIADLFMAFMAQINQQKKLSEKDDITLGLLILSAAQGEQNILNDEVTAYELVQIVNELLELLL